MTHYKREMKDFSLVDLVCIYHNIVFFAIKQEDFENVDDEQFILAFLVGIFHRISKKLYF